MDAIDTLQQRLAAAGYVAERSLAGALYLMQSLQRPLLIEGDAGVGKTEVAKALAAVHGARLIRLQCYEGLDVNSAVYEWNYQRQILSIQLQHGEALSAAEKEAHIFSEAFLLKRPLLQAISEPVSCVLLIDEIDRADEAFEAFLLEVLSDFAISVPEIGTLTALSIPRVVLTSNGVRELSDALRRRCLYHYLDYPSFEKELMILETRLPEIPARLARQIVEFVQTLRAEDLRKKPGIAETLDWALALVKLELTAIEGEHGMAAMMDTLACLLKTREDRSAMTPAVVARIAATC